MRKYQYIQAMRQVGYTDHAIRVALTKIQDDRDNGKFVRYEDYLPDGKRWKIQKDE